MRPCGARRTGSGRTAMPHRAIAIVAAMRRELVPLLQSVQADKVDGVELFELDAAVVAIGGIGKKAAGRATEVVIRYCRPELVVSAGIAGAVSPKLKTGVVGRAREVIDVESGVRYPADGGEWAVATASGISSPAGKRDLALKFGADVVDMECAAVAEVAREHGLEFAAVKAVADEADFDMPPMAAFVAEDGRFQTGRFVSYVALRPKLWPAVNRLRKVTTTAAVNLSSAVTHLMNEYSVSQWGENVPQA